MAAAIAMDSGGKIAMDGNSGNGQRWRSGCQDGGVITIGNGTAATRWTAQWVADDCHQHRSSAMGGNTRWTSEVITMDSGTKIVMDGNSGDGQRRRNGWGDRKTIAMGNGTAAAQWTAQ